MDRGAWGRGGYNPWDHQESDLAEKVVMWERLEEVG